MYWRIAAATQSTRGQHLKLIGFSPQPEQTRQMLLEHGFADARVWPMERPLRADYSNTMFGDARFAIANWRSLSAAMAQAESETSTIDFAFILWLDPFLATFLPGVLVDIVFRRPWAGLYLQPFTFRIRQSRRWLLLGKVFPRYGPVYARKCRAILTFDEYIAPAMAAATNKPVLALPDVCDASAPDQDCKLAKLIKEKSGGKLVCGLIGVLSKRKGVMTLIEAAKALPPGWFFVFAGGFSETEFSTTELSSIKEFARSEPVNCICWFNFLPNEAFFNAVVSACDVLYANYPRFPYSSGIVSKAALFKKPVIVSDRFLLSERVAHFKLGWLLPEENVSALVDLLAHSDRQAVMSKQRSARFDDYNAEHSELRLNSVLDELLAKLAA
jgi:glycosyltransferase involved in cell wall biosynthesis